MNFESENLKDMKYSHTSDIAFHVGLFPNVTYFFVTRDSVLHENLIFTFILTFIFTTLQSPEDRMYRTIKYLMKKKKEVDLQRAVSLDEGLNLNSLSVKKDFATSEQNGEDNKISLLYLHRVLGQDLLGTILTNCAKVEPDDPILFVAALLERYSRKVVC